jgi:gliotoxin/aspirochlorine biosynthesis thioredoxin reductase
MLSAGARACKLIPSPVYCCPLKCTDADDDFLRFHCLFCHGFEERGADSVGVLAGGFIANADMVAHVSRMAKRLSKSVTIYTNGNADIATALPSRIHSTKITVDPRPVKKFALVEGGPRVQVTLEDGETVTQGFVVSHPNVRQRADDLTKQLGLEMTPTGEIKVNAPFNETSVPGCFAAGDAATMMRSVVQSMSMGGFAAVGAIGAIQHELDLKDEL